jgi:hypothetical protein
LEVKLIVRVVNGKQVVGGYVRDLELPFVPTIGMKFEQGSSTWLWETVNGKELNPSVQEVIYDNNGFTSIIPSQ